MTISTGCRLTIFEGPDGSGKTTKAMELALQTDAKYVHLGPLPHVTDGYARLCVEAMLPALLGYQDVVLDRSWLSEEPYAVVFRDGSLRVDQLSQRMLERLALRCSTVLVRCDPGWELVQNSYLSRQGVEYLDDTKQLRRVYELYQQQASSLPMVTYNYTTDQDLDLLDGVVRADPHPLQITSAGSLEAKVVLVGEGFAEHKNQDPWYQWPFASFSGNGCSRWLAQQLEEAGVTEDQLLWVNADQPLEQLILTGRTVIALGTTATARLSRLGIKHQQVVHPQHHKRFYYNKEYALIKLLKEVL